jgi:hypothetical protein
MEYRFIGAESLVGNNRLDSLGQKITLSEADGLMAMQGGCVLIPAAEYQKLGITPEEEKQCRFAAQRQKMPEALKAKLAAGVRRYQILIDEAAMGIDVSNVKGASPVLPAPPPVQMPATPAEEKGK